jgi:hypothetical protein
MPFTLTQFEQIEGLFTQLTRMGDFEACADPRGYIRISNRLFDACVDAIGYAAADAFASAEECAANILTDCWTGKVEVVDVEAA